MHLADIYLPELDSALSRSEVNGSLACPLAQILAPFVHLAAHTRSQTVYKRLMASLFEPLLHSFEVADPSFQLRDDEPQSKKRKRVYDEHDGEVMFAHIVKGCCVGQAREDRDGVKELRQAVLRRLFEAGSEAGTGEWNRRRLYALWRERGEVDDED